MLGSTDRSNAQRIGPTLCLAWNGFVSLQHRRGTNAPIVTREARELRIGRTSRILTNGPRILRSTATPAIGKTGTVWKVANPSIDGRAMNGKEINGNKNDDGHNDGRGDGKKNTQISITKK